MRKINNGLFNKLKDRNHSGYYSDTPQLIIWNIRNKTKEYKPLRDRRW